jgi:hypothetical protein
MLGIINLVISYNKHIFSWIKKVFHKVSIFPGFKITYYGNMLLLPTIVFKTMFDFKYIIAF